MSNLDIAREIVKQAGGFGRLSSFIGAKNFVAIPNGVQFQVPSNLSPKGVNRVKVVLSPADVYEVEFGYARGKSYKVKSEASNVYWDELRGCIESNLGLYLSF